MPTVSPPEWVQRVGESEIAWRARLGRLIDAGRPRTGYNVREGAIELAARFAPAPAPCPATRHAHDCDCRSRPDGSWHIDPACVPAGTLAEARGV